VVAAAMVAMRSFAEICMLFLLISLQRRFSRLRAISGV